VEHSVELEDQSFMKVLASECIVIIPRTLAQRTLLIALAMD
jgi:hypothetical protein